MSLEDEREFMRGKRSTEHSRQDWGVAQVVELLPSQHKFNPQYTTNKKNVSRKKSTLVKGQW
jgi:hypothetical protein